ncbi:hypothetical protein V6N12_029229 [Hibiscus sabdariffa]|uniref:Gnk2-homologous domain-containing protein n=1 Tax=Hibiscus sabdariffa TaxID=183260 RepID=A0ABR2CVJ5_9ROSI
MLKLNTPDLSGTDCGRCVRGAMAYLPTEREGGASLTPSCMVRYGFNPFFSQTTVVALPPSAREEKKQNKSIHIQILVASLSATFGLAVVSASGFFIWRRRRNTQGMQWNNPLV